MCSGYSVHMDTAWTDNFLSTEKFDFEPGNFELLDILNSVLSPKTQSTSRQQAGEIRGRLCYNGEPPLLSHLPAPCHLLPGDKRLLANSLFKHFDFPGCFGVHCQDSGNTLKFS